MKRLIKQINRKGFTLVETLLATFILVVVSTMLINGFIATMGYSYQTSVYSKSGSNNYTACMATLATWSDTPNTGTGGREEQGKGYCSGNRSNATVLTFEEGSITASFEDVFVHIEAETDLDSTVPTSLPFGQDTFAPSADDLADNRKTFVYYPEYWQKDGNNATLGKVVVMYNADTGKYYWVIDEAGGSQNLESAPLVVNTPIGS